MNSVFALYDRKANFYFGISMSRNTDTYLRSLSDLPLENLYRKHAADYDIFKVADFDERTGALSPSLDFVCCLSEVFGNN